ncbi:MAG: cyclic pyranopterin monophosphate synthase MoaC [Collinsella intestinalis]
MVDVGDKQVTKRIAIAEGTILMHPETQAMVLEDRAKKGDVLACARVAGIMASKRTSDLIPMCHPLNITKAKVEIEPISSSAVAAPGWAPAREDHRVGFHVLATCGVTGVTGIEMETLTAASTACLTIYDMCKAVDRGMEIVDVRLRGRKAAFRPWERDGSAHTDEVDAEAKEAEIIAAELPSPLPGGPRTGTPAPAVAFVGYQNAGKTTLVEKVISRLAQRGVRVGSIKHHGHKGFDIDQPGKDSWRHAQAGSRHVGLISPTCTPNTPARPKRCPCWTCSRATPMWIPSSSRATRPLARRASWSPARASTHARRDSFELINNDTIAVACTTWWRVISAPERSRAALPQRPARLLRGGRPSAAVPRHQRLGCHCELCLRLRAKGALSHIATDASHRL